MQKVKQNAYTRFVGWIAKTFLFKKADVVYEEAPAENEVGVYCVNHAGANGPSLMTLHFEAPHRTWIISYVLNKKQNVKFIFNDFMCGPGRKNQGGWKFLAKITAKFLLPLLYLARPIPVFHDRRVMDTLKDSVEALQNGDNIVLFPERPQKFSEFVFEIYDGFADLGRSYYNATGKKLKFYPTYVENKSHKIMIAKPIEYDPTVNPKAERKAISEYVRDGIDRMGRSLPEHKPVPFLEDFWFKTYGQYVDHIQDYWAIFETTEEKK